MGDNEEVRTKPFEGCIEYSDGTFSDKQFHDISGKDDSEFISILNQLGLSKND